MYTDEIFKQSCTAPDWEMIIETDSHDSIFLVLLMVEAGIYVCPYKLTQARYTNGKMQHGVFYPPAVAPDPAVDTAWRGGTQSRRRQARPQNAACTAIARQPETPCSAPAKYIEYMYTSHSGVP